MLFRVEFSALADEHKAVNVGQGFPDFSPPDHVKEALNNVSNDHHLIHQYTRGFVSCVLVRNPTFGRSAIWARNTCKRIFNQLFVSFF